MTQDPLVRPMWNALNGLQAHLAKHSEDGMAVRLDPGYGAFAGAADRSEAAQAALAGMIGDGDDRIWVVETEEWPAPNGIRVAGTVPLVQMVAGDVPALEPGDDEVILLGADHAAAMGDLAHAAEPGPWGPLTSRYGDFYGSLWDGELRAMAGERFRPAAGLSEVSGVATALAWRGRGLAARCIRRVMHGFRARGAEAYLHCRAENDAAIRLYEALGFSFSRTMTVTVLERE